MYNKSIKVPVIKDNQLFYESEFFWGIFKKGIKQWIQICLNKSMNR